jgi:hypothetical protein
MQSRREFLSSTGIGLASIALGNSRAYSKEDDEFVFVQKGGLPEIFINHGNIEKPTEYLVVVSFPHLIFETEAYEQMMKEKVKEGTAKYNNLKEKAQRTAQSWVDRYARGKEVIIDRTYADKSKAKVDDVFLEVPEDYRGYSLVEIMDKLDETKDVLEMFDK